MENVKVVQNEQEFLELLMEIMQDEEISLYQEGEGNNGCTKIND